MEGFTATVSERGTPMATYECSSCGMSVNASCGACDTPLVDAILTKDDGSTVQVSECLTATARSNRLCAVAPICPALSPKPAREGL